MQPEEVLPAVVPAAILTTTGNEEARGLMLSVVQRFAEKASLTIVSDQASFNGASETLREVAGLTKRVEEARKTETKPLLDEKRRIDDAYKGADSALGDARARLEGGMNAYRTEQRRIAFEAQQRENARAEAERQRLAKLAQKAEARGDFSKAAQYEQKADMAVAAVVVTEAPKAAGISERTIWKFAIDNEQLVPREYLTPDMDAIGAFVRSLKAKAVGRIAGVRVYSEEVTAVRGQ